MLQRALTSLSVFGISMILLTVVSYAQQNPDQQPYEQEFVITAYYSPLPNQCCYVRGGYEPEKVLNGQGVQGADGTLVYPGMVAAPPSIAFGTRIELPGMGVVEVNDRGGAIQTLGDGAIRLDIWMGYGEEGLARALALGLRRVKGTIYPVGTMQPDIQFNVNQFKAPLNYLRPYLVHMLPAIDMARGQKGYSIQLVQNYLKDLGYFSYADTGLYGEITKEALASFQADYSIADESSDVISPRTAATVIAAHWRRNAHPPINGYVDQTSSFQRLAQAQRVLRFLGYYHGRTDGIYSDALRDAIITFQLDRGVIPSENSNGSGRIGPSTLREITKLVQARHVATQANRLLDLRRIEEHMEQHNMRLMAFLEHGWQGSQVQVLQELLASLNYFPREEVNAVFGPLTAQSVAKFQLDYGIINSLEDTFAGVVGPQTLTMIHHIKRLELYSKVKEQGWGILNI